MTDDVIYGTRGVLAYDEATDRVQCHVCGGWYRILSADHLKRHGLTAAAYKECYGLSRTVRLESPNVTTSHRRNRELLAPRHVRPVVCVSPAFCARRGAPYRGRRRVQRAAGDARTDFLLGYCWRPAISHHVSRRRVSRTWMM